LIGQRSFSISTLFETLWPEDRPIAWVVFFAVLFYVFYAIFQLVAPSVAYFEDKVSLLYLPAFVRVLAVLVAGVAGALGIFIGHLMVYAVYKSDPWMFSLSASVINALAPLCALIATRAIFRSSQLILLGWKPLFLVAFLSALFAGLFKNTFWAISGLHEIATLPHATANFLGNLFGILGCFVLFQWLRKSLPFQIVRKKRI
jgi:hypothetical protein